MIFPLCASCNFRDADRRRINDNQQKPPDTRRLLILILLRERPGLCLLPQPSAARKLMARMAAPSIYGNSIFTSKKTGG